MKNRLLLGFLFMFLGLIFTAQGQHPTPDNVFLGPWKVIGPFPAPKDGEDTIKTDFLAGEATITPSKEPVTWKDNSYSWKDYPFHMINFEAIWTDRPAKLKEHVVGYAYTTIISDADKTKTLAFGKDDHIAIWLNGELVYGPDEENSAVYPDQFKVQIDLKKGENSLLLKVYDAGSDWGAVARLLPVDYEEPFLTFRYGLYKTTGVVEIPQAEISLFNKEKKLVKTLPVSAFRKEYSDQYYYYNLYTEDDFSDEVNTVQVRVLRQGEAVTDQTFSFEEAKSEIQTLETPPLFAVKGRVLDTVTGAGAKGISIQAENKQQTTTDENGEFTLEGVDERHIHFYLQGRGYLFQDWQTMVASGQQVEMSVTPGGTTMVGRVLNTDGEPIAGVEMTTYGNQPVRTNEKGEYVWPGITARKEGDTKRNIYPVVRHPDYAPLGSFAVEVDLTGDEFTYDFTMEPSGGVAGRVTDGETGAPIEGVSILAGKDRFASNTTANSVKTDENGEYELKGLPLEEIGLLVMSPDWAPDITRIRSKPGQMLEVNFELKKGRSASGRITDIDGNPIKGVRLVTDTWRGLRLINKSTTTDKDGQFVFPNMPQDEVEVDIFKGGYSSQRNVKVTGGQTELEITLNPYAFASGTVLDKETGEPIPEFKVIRGLIFHNSSHVSWQRRHNVIEGKDGHFEEEFSELSRYDIKFLIEADGYRPHEIKDVVLKEGERIEDLEVKLEKGVALYGTVTNEEGEPVEGALVKLFNDTAPVWIQNRYSNTSDGPEAHTDNEGKFSISSATNGIWRAYVSLEEVGATFSEPFKIGDQITELNVTIKPFGSVEGYFVLGGKMAAGEDIQVHGKPDASNRSKQINLADETDDEGYFLIENIPAGEYSICQSISYGNSSSYSRMQPVSVTSGKRTFIAIGAEGKCTVEGTVTYTDGNPIPDLGISLYKQGGAITQFGTATDANGHYKLTDIPSGSYNFSANRYTCNDPSSEIRHHGNVKLISNETVIHDVEIPIKKPWGAGFQLPELTGETIDGASFDLANVKEDHILMATTTPLNKEEEEENFYSKNRDLFKELSIRVVLPFPKQYYEGEGKKKVKEAHLDEYLVLTKDYYLSKLHEHVTNRQDISPVLIDKEGKILHADQNPENLINIIKEENESK